MLPKLGTIANTRPMQAGDIDSWKAPNQLIAEMFHQTHIAKFQWTTNLGGNGRNA